MWKDLFLQALMFSVTIFMFLWTLNYPQKLYHKLRLRLRLRKQPPNLQAKRQFVLAAHLLSQFNRSKSSSSSSDLLNQALSAADEAASLDPKDAAAHILKALILELQGFYSSAIDSLDAALSPLAVKSLADDERSHALCKRAQLKLAAGGRLLDSAIDDLLESVKMNKNGAGKAFGLLGECYEKKGLKMEAQKAYQDAITVQPNYYKARLPLDRLRSSSSSSFL